MSKILIIEDDKILQKAIKTALESAGYEVEQAFDGKEGFTKIEEVKPDLIILDLIMPVKTGEWVLEQMNKHKIIKKYPLVVFTIKNSMSSISNCIAELDVKNYLFKGDYDLEDVVKKVDSLLEK